MQQQNNGASLVAVQGCYTTKEFPHLRHSPCDYHISWYTGEKAYIVESIIVYTEEGSRAAYDQWVCLPSPPVEHGCCTLARRMTACLFRCDRTTRAHILILLTTHYVAINHRVVTHGLPAHALDCHSTMCTVLQYPAGSAHAS